jgi:hypothetical protein
VSVLIVGNGEAADAYSPSWGKLIRDLRDINLSARGGYALSGEFHRWGDAVAIEPGQYLVCCYGVWSQRGSSRRIRVYDHAGERVEIDQAAIDTLPDTVRANALNSALYRVAADLWVRLQTSKAPMPESAKHLDPVEAVWQQIQALSPPDRAVIFGRLLAEDG